MNSIVLDRLREVCPLEKVSDKSSDELIRDCKVAFEIIGYSPRNLEKSVQMVIEKSSTDDLSDFIFEVWRCDK